MGLDMYLKARQYVGRFDEGDKMKVKTLEDTFQTGDTTDISGWHVEIPVGYWRKANAVHGWFIRECANTEDNCEPIELPVTKLKELGEIVAQLLKAFDEKDPELNTLAGELLPPTEGFFFGSTEINDWYWEDIASTDKIIKHTLALCEKNNIDCLVYQASW